MNPFLRLLLTTCALTLSTAHATGMLGNPMSMLNSSFCKSQDCGLVGRQRITSTITADVFVTRFHHQNADGYPSYGINIDVFSNGGKVVSARLNPLLQDDPFLNSTTTDTNTFEYVAAEFVQLMTGKRPAIDVLKRWQEGCVHPNTLNKLVPFAGHFLACESTGDRPERNAAHVTLSVLY